MCGVPGVPRSTYYCAISHPEPERADDPIAGDVVRIYEDNRREYGASKIKRALAREGIVASRRRIKRMMNQKGLVSAYTRKKYKPRAVKASEAEASNVLDREFDGHPPHTHIVSDLTYVRVGSKWNYVCLLIELYNREIVRHAASGRKDARLVRAAFAALGSPLTDIDVFHTDRGSEFANSDIDDLLEAFDIRRSESAQFSLTTFTPPWGGLLPRANWPLRTRRGAEIAQRRVHPRPVVDDLDVLEQVQRRLLAGSVGLRMHALRLHDAHGRLHGGVVPRR